MNIDLAMTLQKEHQLTKINDALTMDQKLKGKGKRRKVVDKTNGKEHYQWFSERKR